MLGGQPQRGAARREHGEVGNGREQLGDLSGVGEEALDAVEDQQRARAARGADDPLAELRRRVGHDPERGRRGRDERALGAREIGVRGAAGEAPDDRARCLQRQPGLADAAGADKCQQPDFGPHEQGADLGQLALATDGRVRRHGQRRAEHVAQRLGLEPRVLGEDHPLEFAQLRARLEPQFLDQQTPARAHHLERVRLTPGAVEREHQLPAQTLPQRVLGDERAQLADEVDGLPAGEPGRQPLLDRLQAQLLQALDLALRELVEAMIGQRRPTPQRERRLEIGRAAVGARALQQRLEAPAVDGVAIDLQRVPGGATADRQPFP